MKRLFPEQRRAVLALADGTLFTGVAYGAERSHDNPALGEVVFNTSLYGYQEILTDPSYAGQLLTFTYPHIGNVGCNPGDYDSDKMYAEGVIIRNTSATTSNFRTTESLDTFLKREQKVGIAGIDTRALVRHLRDNGSQMGAIASGDSIDTATLVDRARAQGSMAGKDYVAAVSCKKPYVFSEKPWSLSLVQEAIAQGDKESLAAQGYALLTAEEAKKRPHVVALDCGIKRSILQLLVGAGFRVTVAPATSTAQEITALKPDALFLSNGPGDPATLGYIVSAVRELIGKLPIFGICLGHQILGQVFGGSTYKLKFGHRGGNHPVIDLKTRSVEITVQNHGFAVDPESLKRQGDAVVSHVNLNDGTVEGLEAPALKAFCVQYHPEASPGPHDARHHFNRFYQAVTC
jgi:carbamoyl-phosphate synthase small subunit